MFFARIVYAKARTRALQRTAPGRLRLSRKRHAQRRSALLVRVV